MCHATSSQPASDDVSTPGEEIPPIGKMPGRPKAPTPKTISRIMPSQNSGMEYSVSVTPVDTLSKDLPRRHPALMPIQTPMIEASTIAVPTSSSVGQMRSVTSSHTGPVELGRVDRAGERVAQVGQELLEDRTVEFRAQCGQLLGRNVASSRVHPDRVARQHPEQEEVDDQDEQQSAQRRPGLAQREGHARATGPDSPSACATAGEARGSDRDRRYRRHLGSVTCVPTPRRSRTVGDVRASSR